MLADEFKTGLADLNKITDYFTKAKEKNIRRITYFDNDHYGSGINVYFMSKKTFSSPVDALSIGWLMQFLWEEDEEIFDFSQKHCYTIAAEFFAQDIKKYRYIPLKENECKNYISSKVEPVILSTTKIQQAEKHPETVEFLSKSGIYVDKKYTVDKAYLFKKDEIYTDGVILYQEKEPAYKEIFFETDSKYVLFLE